jgi:hypothetical protein
MTKLLNNKPQWWELLLWQSSYIAYYNDEIRQKMSLKIPTILWPKEKVQKDKQRSTKHTHKTIDRVTRTPLKPGVNSGAPDR